MSEQQRTTGSADPEQKRIAAIARITGTESAIEKIAAKLRFAEANCNLLAAASTVAPPEGFAVTFNTLWMNQEDCYSVGGGKFALFSSALQRLAQALSIAWDGALSGRTDDGKDPRRCAYKAVGHYRGLDGQRVTVIGEKELDLNDGSDQVVAMKQRASNAAGFEKQLRDARLFILPHAETKAQSRAIRRAVGIRSYTPDELRKPFVVPTLSLTGEYADPETRRAVAIMQAQAHLGASSALYGAPPAPALPLPKAELAELPPTFEDYDDQGEVYDRPDWNDQ